jgi:hypothetical protein
MRVAVQCIGVIEDDESRWLVLAQVPGHARNLVDVGASGLVVVTLKLDEVAEGSAYPGVAADAAGPVAQFVRVEAVLQ